MRTKCGLGYSHTEEEAAPRVHVLCRAKHQEVVEALLQDKKTAWKQALLSEQLLQNKR